MTEIGDPYEGVDPRLAWMLRVLSDEFGMLGVMEAQQAAYYYANTKGRIDNRLGPGHSESDRKSCMSCHISAPACDRRRTEVSEACCGFCEVETYKVAHPVRKTTKKDVRVSPHADRETATAWSAAFDAMSLPEDQPVTFSNEESAAEYVEGYEARNAAAWERGKESDGQMLARLGTDAEKWAEEFRRTFVRHGLDKGTLIAWFANAIGAGESKRAVELDYLAYLVGRHYREKAHDWFENYYGTENFKPPGPGGLIADWAEKLSKTREALDELKKNFASAPDGWFPFGTHAAVDDVRLEFWGADEAGTPIFERPVTEDEIEPEALTGVVRPRDESDDEHYFNATTRMRERAERAEARLSEMRTVRDEMQHRIETLEGELAGAYRARPICYEPIAPMSIGSTCEKCGHHSMAHTDNGPCLVCVLEGKYGARIASA